ncbi:hypothetical protein ACFL4W_04740 [Planctomycetota bacterium]
MAGKLILITVLLVLALSAGADEAVLQQGLSAYGGCTDTYLQESQGTTAYGAEEQVTVALAC